MSSNIIKADNGASSGITGIVQTAGSDGTLQLQTTTSGGTATTALTLNNSQQATFANTINVPNTFGFKNRIINGAMNLYQRATGTVTPTAWTYTLDRWNVETTVASKFTVQQSSSAPAGFNNSYLLTSTSAYSVSSGDTIAVAQYIEGYNWADLGWGTANAKTVTLSFWVQSSLTGTFGGSIENYARTRSYPFIYTISSANTWTQISVTIAGDTSGTWVGASNAGAVCVLFEIGAGSTFSGTAGSWASADYRGATGATNILGTNGATFYITGVQLEVGTQATSFDYRPYGTELQLCQRYYWQLTGSTTQNQAILNFAVWATTGNYGTLFFPCVMRTVPSGSYSSLNDFILLAAGTTKIPTAIASGSSGQNASTVSSEIAFTTTTGFTQGWAGWVRFNTNTTSAYLAFSAEL